MRTRIVSFLLILSAITSAQNLPSGYRLTPAGKFEQTTGHNRISENGIFSCTYRITSAGDENRDLTDFIFYKNGSPVYSLYKAPGADLYISNSGIAAFLDHTYHFRNLLTIRFYSAEGNVLRTLTFEGAYLFGFSEDGNHMGIGTPGKLTLYNIPENKTVLYPGCMQFALSENAEYLVTADQKSLYVYHNNELVYSLPLSGFVRSIKISGKDSFSYITKQSFVTASLTENKISYSQNLPNGKSYNDLLLADANIYTGISLKEGGKLSSYYSVYEKGRLSEPIKVNIDPDPPVEIEEPIKDSIYSPIPWPFAPFDSMRTAWNHYEQNMGSGDPSWSYLHQGLDLIVPIAEPAYTVEQGVVKLVLTLGGDSYWRVAVSPVQEPGWSDGWLYAHLIPSSITVNVGDTVDIHEHLGNIVEWAYDWGHIHFVQINDSGTVWLYADNEWGINFNPYLALQPVPDTTAPVFENSSLLSKFEFCRNETSEYLTSDSLNGEIDIIINVYDYIGDSEWKQPAFKSYYWIKRLADDTIVYPRTLGHMLNHRYTMYEASHYEPYAKILYKLDDTHPASSWMDMDRNYYHIITNDNGDDVLEPDEKYLALNTALFYDGEYRIFVEVFDPAGNSAVDSMDVKFINGVTSVTDNNIPRKMELLQNYPNPFNPSTTIVYRINSSGNVKLELFDFLGQRAALLLDEYKEAGSYKTNFNCDDYNLSSGIYFYKLTAGGFSSVRKLVLLK